MKERTEEQIREMLGGAVFNLSHQKGGTGKSTLSYNLSAGFEKLGIKVRIIDLDVQQTCTALNRLREVTRPNIEIINNEEDLIEAINNVNDDEILVIDSGGFDSKLTRLAIKGADINITPLGDQVTEILAAMDKYSPTLAEINANSDYPVITHVLLNGIHLFATKFDHLEEMIEDEPHMTLLSSVVRDRSIFNKSLIDGRTVYEADELKGHEGSVEDIDRLCNELIEIYSRGV